MKKLIIFLFIILSPISLFAETSISSDTDSMVAQLKAIIDQYGAKIKALETENAILRNEVMKAGITIPLSVYSGAIATVVTTPTSSSSSGSVVSPGTTTGSTVDDNAIKQIAAQYSSQYAGFISRIHTEWVGIQGAYKIPQTAYIGGYEFVKKGNDNNVFVDIVYTGTTASGVYDAKILYEYHTGTYQRKLVGFFEFNKASGYYITRTGTNPFAGVARVFVADPLAGVVGVPATATSSTTASGQTATTTTVTTTVPTLAEIEKAYGDKRYLTTISLSTSYLAVNPATVDILRIRYRTFFIIGKYSESLGEIAKIESLGKLDKAIACDAQVISTYSKDQTLVDKYTKVCKGS